MCFGNVGRVNMLNFVIFVYFIILWLLRWCGVVVFGIRVVMFFFWGDDFDQDFGQDDVFLLFKELEMFIIKLLYSFCVFDFECVCFDILLGLGLG